MIGKFIRAASYSAKLGNFYSVFSILGALCFPEVTQLRAAWKIVPEKTKRLQSELEQLMNPTRNMKAYRDQLTAFAGQSRVPCLPLHLKDLVFANEVGSLRAGDEINFEKLTLVSRCVALLVTLPQYLDIRPDPALQAYIKRVPYRDHRRTTCDFGRRARAGVRGEASFRDLAVARNGRRHAAVVVRVAVRVVECVVQCGSAAEMALLTWCC